MASEERVEVRRQRGPGQRKLMFLRTYVQTRDLEGSLAKVGIKTRWTLWHWRHTDPRFRDSFDRAERAIEVEGGLVASDSTPAEQKRVFLDTYALLGTTTTGCDRAGIEMRTLDEWLRKDRAFRDGFHEAKLRFLDLIEKKIMESIESGKDKSGVMLRFKAQAELPEKYGRPGKQGPAKGQQGLTMEDLEQLVRESDDAAAS